VKENWFVETGWLDCTAKLPAWPHSDYLSISNPGQNEAFAPSRSSHCRETALPRAAVAFPIHAAAAAVSLAGLFGGCVAAGRLWYDPHFFKRLKIGGEDFFVQNEDFSFRFSPRKLCAVPVPSVSGSQSTRHVPHIYSWANPPRWAIRAEVSRRIVIWKCCCGKNIQNEKI